MLWFAPGASRPGVAARQDGLAKSASGKREKRWKLPA